MANINITPALSQLVNNSTDVYASISNFIVDNNEQGVFTVLRANGYVFNTHGEAAAIVKSILLGTSEKNKNEALQLNRLPYLNDNTNGTGGLTGDITGSSTFGASSVAVTDLVCIVSSLFKKPLLCDTGDTDTPLTPEQIAAEKKSSR